MQKSSPPTKRPKKGTGEAKTKKPKDTVMGQRIAEFARTKFKSVAAMQRTVEKKANYFAPYTSGRSRPGYDVLKVLCGLGLNINWLLLDDQNGEQMMRGGMMGLSPTPVSLGDGSSRISIAQVADWKVLDDKTLHVRTKEGQQIIILREQ